MSLAVVAYRRWASSALAKSLASCGNTLNSSCVPGCFFQFCNLVGLTCQALSPVGCLVIGSITGLLSITWSSESRTTRSSVSCVVALLSAASSKKCSRPKRPAVLISSIRLKVARLLPCKRRAASSSGFIVRSRSLP